MNSLIYSSEENESHDYATACGNLVLGYTDDKFFADNRRMKVIEGVKRRRKMDINQDIFRN